VTADRPTPRIAAWVQALASQPRALQRNRAHRNPRALQTTRAGLPRERIPRGSGSGRVPRGLPSGRVPRDGDVGVEPQHDAAARIAAQPRATQPARTVHNARGPPGGLVPRGTARRAGSARDRQAARFRGIGMPTWPSNRSTTQPRALQRSRAHRSARAPYTTRAGPVEVVSAGSALPYRSAI